MFTTIDKAIVAILSGVIYLLSYLGVIPPDFVSPETIAALAAVITPALVWWIPNKAPE